MCIKIECSTNVPWIAVDTKKPSTKSKKRYAWISFNTHFPRHTRFLHIFWSHPGWEVETHKSDNIPCSCVISLIKGSCSPRACTAITSTGKKYQTKLQFILINSQGVRKHMNIFFCFFFWNIRNRETERQTDRQTDIYDNELHVIRSSLSASENNDKSTRMNLRRKNS